MANIVRPYISFAVGSLSRYCARPITSHWNAAKRLLRYLKETRYKRIVYCASVGSEILGFADLEFAGDNLDRMSTTKYIFQLAAVTISRRYKNQTIVALSTSEAEYFALSTAARDVTWLKSLSGNDVGLVASSVVCLKGDKQIALQMAQEAKLTEASKNISIYYHFILEKVEQGYIVLRYVPSENNIADILTTGLGGQACNKLAKLLGIILGIYGAME